MQQVKLCGIFIEPRHFANVPILINNFNNVLSDTTLFFFCGKSVFSYYTEYYKHNSFVIVKDLGVDNLLPNDHNDLWKTLDFLNNFDSFTHLLTIQTDGCLCENSEFKIYDFFKYDYIGGYTAYKWWWKETKGLHNYSDFQCFNGGFSFRNIAAMKDVILHFPPLKTQSFSPNLTFETYGEDLYYVVGMLKLKNYNVALDEYAINFCTHTHYVKKTFCVHKYDNYVNENQLNKFLEYCPLFTYFTGKNAKLKEI